MVKNPPVMQETQVQSLSWEDSLEKEMATHFSVLALRIPGTGEPGGMPSMPPSPSPTESIRLFYTSVSLLLSRTQGYCYPLSKFHIYALVYCIGVFLSGLLHSV